MNIAQATAEDIEAMAKDLATVSGKEWDKLSEDEKHHYLIEASFVFNWFC